jgi:hypothetical protein
MDVYCRSNEDYLWICIVGGWEMKEVYIENRFCFGAQPSSRSNMRSSKGWRLRLPGIEFR